MKISKSAIKRMANGKVFKVSFMKANGDLRNMTCRLNVTKHLKGGVSSVEGREDRLVVYEMKGKLQPEKPMYRTLPLDRLISFQCGDVKING